MISRSRAAARLLLALLLMSVCYLNFWSYSRQEQANPELFSDVARGTASAPQQYRVLVVRTAWLMHTHTPLKMRHAFALIDGVCAFVAGFVLLRLMERLDAFRAADETGQRLAYAAFLFLFAYYLTWLTWYQRPETLPTACFISLMVLLLSLQPVSRPGYVALGTATLAVAALQALVRADVSVCVYLGVIATVLMHRDTRPQKNRIFTASTAMLAIALACGIQWLLMHRVYPEATYGDTKVFQLLYNLSAQSIVTLAVFIAPVAWTMSLVAKRLARVPVPFLALSIASVFFLLLWLCVGRVQEVRIFLPFALALAPLTAAFVLPKEANAD